MELCDSKLNPQRKGLVLFDLTDAGMANMDVPALRMIISLLVRVGYAECVCRSCRGQEGRMAQTSLPQLMLRQISCGSPLNGMMMIVSGLINAPAEFCLIVMSWPCLTEHTICGASEPVDLLQPSLHLLGPVGRPEGSAA